VQLLSGEYLTVTDYFGPIQEVGTAPFVAEAAAIERDAAIEKHPFFPFAQTHRDAVVFWASQEAVVTNPFSQTLFRVLANIKNVHIRSVLMPVVEGEHDTVQSGIARRSHPWLLWELCLAIGIDPHKIRISEAVRQFIAVLNESANNPMRALGVLGIGNEMMLVEEYAAIRTCFDAHFPNKIHNDFLQANISEDVSHTRIIGHAATALWRLGFSATDFVSGARDGVAARVNYYDMLLRELDSAHREPAVHKEHR